MFLRGVFRLGLAAFVALAIPAAIRADEPVDFAKDVKPVLLAKCGKCHGAEKPKAGLRLVSSAGLKTGGDSGVLFVATKPAESLLVKVLSGADDTSRMPPED